MLPRNELIESQSGTFYLKPIQTADSRQPRAGWGGVHGPKIGLRHHPVRQAKPAFTPAYLL